MSHNYLQKSITKAHPNEWEDVFMYAFSKKLSNSLRIILDDYLDRFSEENLLKDESFQHEPLLEYLMEFCQKTNDEERAEKLFDVYREGIGTSLNLTNTQLLRLLGSYTVVGEKRLLSLVEDESLQNVVRLRAAVTLTG